MQRNTYEPSQVNKPKELLSAALAANYKIISKVVHFICLCRLLSTLTANIPRALLRAHRGSLTAAFTAA